MAPDRLPSLGDPEMRHGRKTRTKPFSGYKRHVLTVLGADIIVGAVARPANEPEHQARAPLVPTLTAHGPLTELFIDRGYLASPTVPALQDTGTAIRAKAGQPITAGVIPNSASRSISWPSASRVPPARR